MKLTIIFSEIQFWNSYYYILLNNLHNLHNFMEKWFKYFLDCNIEWGSTGIFKNNLFSNTLTQFLITFQIVTLTLYFIYGVVNGVQVLNGWLGNLIAKKIFFFSLRLSQRWLLQKPCIKYNFFSVNEGKAFAIMGAIFLVYIIPLCSTIFLLIGAVKVTGDDDCLTF